MVRSKRWGTTTHYTIHTKKIQYILIYVAGEEGQPSLRTHLRHRNRASSLGQTPHSIITSITNTTTAINHYHFYFQQLLSSCTLGQTLYSIITTTTTTLMNQYHSYYHWLLKLCEISQMNSHLPSTTTTNIWKCILVTRTDPTPPPPPSLQLPPSTDTMQAPCITTPHPPCSPFLILHDHHPSFTMVTTPHSPWSPSLFTSAKRMM